MSTEKESDLKQPEEKKMSLLKPFTNFENIKTFSIDDMADFINEAGCKTCADFGESDCGDCINGIKRWLESEVQP